ncbi:MAG TPA: TOBE domain-containing protein, partial [Burkholderiales bacterium]|nr:TOBE domain-containing protein [Burkholderiales bacterium]
LLHDRLKATIVYVTHDQIEAMTLGSKIAVMQGGEIRQFGSPQEIYDKPADLFVAGFIGSPSMNFIKAQVVEDGGGIGMKLQTDEESFVLPLREAGEPLRAHAGKTLILGIRPEQISDAGTAQRGSRNVYSRKFKIGLVEPTGPDTLLFVRINGEQVCCRVRPEQAVAAGESMELALDLSKAVFFDPETGKRAG